MPQAPAHNQPANRISSVLNGSDHVDWGSSAGPPPDCSGGFRAPTPWPNPALISLLSRCPTFPILAP